jgi:hypothetical protein
MAIFLLDALPGHQDEERTGGEAVSYEEIDDGRMVKCRKKWTCEWCGEAIESRSSCIKRTYRFDDEFNDYRQHPECYAAMQRDPDSTRGFTFGGQRRGMTIWESENDDLKRMKEASRD